MSALGYERFGVHGTDVGSGVAGMLPMVAPGRVVGTHITGTAAAMPFGPPLELEGLGPADRERAERFNAFREDGLGYLHLMAARPRRSATCSPTRRSGSSPGSPRSSASGRTRRPSCPRTPSTATCS